MGASMSSTNVFTAQDRLVEALYLETIQLLEEARDFALERYYQRSDKTGPLEQIVIVGESMRVTTRLIEAMAWVLVRRAVIKGEMTERQACSSEHRLGGREICLKRDERLLERIPEPLRTLWESTYRLYHRISRLDDSLAAAAAK